MHPGCPLSEVPRTKDRDERSTGMGQKRKSVSVRISAKLNQAARFDTPNPLTLLLNNQTGCNDTSRIPMLLWYIVQRSGIRGFLRILCK